MICTLGDLLLDVIVRLDGPIAEDTDTYGRTRVGPGGQAANVAAWTAALGGRAKGAFVLVETEELADLDGLFREYVEAGHIERRAIAAGAAGLVYMSSRPGNILARHNAALGWANRHPMMMMERDAAARAS